MSETPKVPGAAGGAAKTGAREGAGRPTSADAGGAADAGGRNRAGLTRADYDGS